MKLSAIVRQHWAALRALLALTLLVGVGYPLLIVALAQIPGLKQKADGSIVEVGGKPLASSLIGQRFTDADGRPLPQYFQSRPSAAGDGYDPMSSGASNLGPESVIDTPGKPSLLTTVCTRSAAVGELEHVDGSRPFCTGGGVGAVLAVIGPRDARGNVAHPTKVVSVNEPCQTIRRPFLENYEGVRVECSEPGEDYASGQVVPMRGAGPVVPAVPADAVSASGSGLDPHISPAYAELQIPRVANARHAAVDMIRGLVAAHTEGRDLGFLGEPRVDVIGLDIALDQQFPLSR